MGNWNITIQGTGMHHNQQKTETGEEFHERDANRMAAEFVQRLKDAGHHIDSATFTHGARDDIKGGRN